MTVSIDPENTVILTHMRLSGSTLEAVTTCEMRLCGDVISRLDERHVRADFHDFTTHFMADDARRVDTAVRPRIPIVDMGIRPQREVALTRTTASVGLVSDLAYRSGQPRSCRCLNEG